MAKIHNIELFNTGIVAISRGGLKMIKKYLPPPSTAVSVANEFIIFGLQDPSAPPVDQMKLQKLLFYSHAWYLAHYAKPLFEENFEAWSWGPVIRDIYSQTSRLGRTQITDKLSECRKDENEIFNIITPEGVVGNELKKFIKTIWDSHKHLTGIQLSNSTHANGEPWTIIKDRYGDLTSKPDIPNSLIESVFKEKIPAQ